jgi:hypothetical protein
VPPFKLDKASAAVFEELIDTGGAVATGRRTYDITNGAAEAKARRIAAVAQPAAPTRA